MLKWHSVENTNHGVIKVDGKEERKYYDFVERVEGNSVVFDSLDNLITLPLKVTKFI